MVSIVVDSEVGRGTTLRVPAYEEWRNGKWRAAVCGDEIIVLTALKDQLRRASVTTCIDVAESAEEH